MNENSYPFGMTTKIGDFLWWHLFESENPDLLTASKEGEVGCPNCKQGTMEDHGEAGTFCNLCNWEKGMVFFDPSKSKEDRGEK